MSSSDLLAALRVVLRPLAAFEDADALREFCESVRAEPRYFGAGSDTKAPPLNVARLLHPAGPPCLGAVLGETLVGIARLEPARGAAPGAELTVVVRAPWRRSGIATKLVRSTLHDPSVTELGTARTVVAKNNRAALALGRACGMERRELGIDRYELRARLGGPTLRCA